MMMKSSLLKDFKKQLEMISKLGSVKDLMAKMPMGGMQMPDNIDEGLFKKAGAICKCFTDNFKICWRNQWLKNWGVKVGKEKLG